MKTLITYLIVLVSAFFLGVAIREYSDPVIDYHGWKCPLSKCPRLVEDKVPMLKFDGKQYLRSPRVNLEIGRRI